MATQSVGSEKSESLESAATLGWGLLAVGLGVVVAGLVLPIWLPGLSASLLSAEPKGYWYLSRTSAFVAYSLLWLSMVMGLLMTNRLARTWPGVPVASDLHQHVSLLGLGFALFHALILLGDRYVQTSLTAVLIPLGYAAYRPLWVGLGQIGFYMMILLTLSFYFRKQLGNRTWRLVHFLSFGTYLLALIHGLGAGTDATAAWAQGIYWVSGGLLLLLFVYRLMGRWITVL